MPSLSRDTICKLGILVATSRAVVRIKLDDVCAELSIVSGAHNIFLFFLCRNMGLLIFTVLLTLLRNQGQRQLVGREFRPCFHVSAATPGWLQKEDAIT